MQKRGIPALLAVVVILSCDNVSSVEKSYSPIDKIDYSVEITNFDQKTIDKEELDFVYYELVILNESMITYCLSIRDIVLSINNTRNNSTYIDSLAAHEGHHEPFNLPSGRTVRRLYSVFPKDTLGKSIRDFEVVEFGLNSEGGCTH